MIVGGNGAGKSTLIKIILNLVKQNDGEVILHSNSIGYVPEKYLLADYLTIIDFLKLLGKMRGMTEDSLNRRIEELLCYWNINDKNKKLKELSKGMMQKVVICQALLHNPDIYIFDEALNGLDPQMQEKLLSIINEEKEKGKLIILTSHYPKLYTQTVDEVLIVSNQGLIKNENN